MDKNRSEKCLLIQAIIDLHEKGYCEDFMPIADDVFSCIGSKSRFSRSQVTLHVYCHSLLKASQRCLYYMESCDGTKGIMLLTLKKFN